MNESYIKLKQIEKDICFLYHEMSEYKGFMGDIDYHNLYNQKYWLYINQDQDPFILFGCLVLIMAKVWDVIDGSGNSFSDKIDLYKIAINDLYPTSEENDRIIEATKLGLDIVSGKSTDNDKFATESGWVYDTFVKGYFRSKL